MVESVVIVGAGPAGLAAAYELKAAGIRPRILDEAEVIAASWRARHDQLHLNTHRWVSHQPGLRMPRRFGAFPSRDDYVSYLAAYAAQLDLPIEFRTQVSRIESGQDGHWSVMAQNETIVARNVVVATGSDRVPHVPDWPGRDGFSGEFIHASRFRHASDYLGKRVLLVGGGNSAVDVGNCLAGVGVGPVWVSVRRGATIAPQYLLGLPSQLLAASLAWLPTAWQEMNMTLASRIFLGDLSRFGWPKATKGPVTRQIEDGVTVAVDNGFVDALRKGRMRIVAEVASFDNATVVLRDGSRLQPDAVICATGYRLGLAGLVGHLDVLDAHGRPVCNALRAANGAPGLWFFGQNASIHGNMNIRRREARTLAAAIAARELY